MSDTAERWVCVWDYFARSAQGQSRRRPPTPLRKTFDNEEDARKHAAHVRQSAAISGGVVVAVVQKEGSP